MSEPSSDEQLAEWEADYLAAADEAPTGPATIKALLDFATSLAYLRRARAGVSGYGFHPVALAAPTGQETTECAHEDVDASDLGDRARGRRVYVCGVCGRQRVETIR